MRQRTEDHEVIVKTTGLRLGYGQRVVLAQVNVEIRAGEFWFFLGPNGEGKTTFCALYLE
jgi:ABC-type cobalamin/Fe3+-siderophores transport system ATPase subunit